MRPDSIRYYLVTYAISFIFIVFGIWEIINPSYWSVFVPGFISGVLGNVSVLVMVHGIILALIGLSLAVGFHKKITSALGTLMMMGILISLYIGSGFTTMFVRDLVITVFTASLFFDK